MADNPIMESCLKYINLQWHGTCNYVKEDLIKIFYIEGTKNPAKMFTKNLDQEALNNCWKYLGLVLYDQPQSEYCTCLCTQSSCLARVSVQHILYYFIYYCSIVYYTTYGYHYYLICQRWDFLLFSA